MKLFEFLKRKKSPPEREFDKEIFLGQIYTKTLIPQFAGWHNYLQTRSGSYRRWHLKSRSKLVHWFILILTIIVFVAVISGAFFIYPRGVQAASLTIWPTAAGDTSQWTASGCSENWDCVNEDPHDNSATEASSIAAGAPRQDLYNLQDTSQTGTINSIAVYFTAACLTCGFPSVAVVIKEGGITTEGTQQVLTSGGFIAYSQAWTTNPRTGAAWQWSEINSLQAGIKDNTRALGQARVTQLYAVVNYNIVTINPPTLTTQSATNITQTTANANGTITNTGGENATARGFKYYQSSNCGGSENDRSESGSFGTGAYSLQLTGLTANTAYSYKSYASNSGGTGYGSCVSFTTLTPPPTINPPTLTTQSATNITQTTASANGTITDNGGENPTARGFKYYQSSNCGGSENDRSESGSFGTGAYSLQLSGFSNNTAYSYKSYAVNSGGTGYGSCVFFTTLDSSPPPPPPPPETYYTLTVSKSGNGSGTIVSSPAGINCGADCSESYLQNTSVTLTSSPQSGSNFIQWSGDCSGSASNCTVVMNGNKLVAAVFDIPPPQTRWCEKEQRYIPEADWSDARCGLSSVRWCELEQRDIPEAGWSKERCYKWCENEKNYILPAGWSAERCVLPVPPNLKWCQLESKYVEVSEWSEEKCSPVKWCEKEEKNILEADWSEEKCSPLPKETEKEIIQKTTDIALAAVEKIKDFLKSPLGSKATKIISTAGLVMGGAALASGNLFFPLSLPDWSFLFLRLGAAVMTAFGLKKRIKPWGVVYDSETKQPLDPAYVVLKDLEGREVASSITDLDGRYGFLAGPGKYRITAQKTNYKFPSEKLLGRDRDELYSGLYFGEEIEIKEAGEVIAKNIPLDPERFDWNEFAKKKKNLLKFYSRTDLVFKRFSDLFFFLGFFVAIIAVVFVPYPYNLIILILYIFLLILRLLGLKPKTCGSVIEKETGFPLSFAILRVFNFELQKEMFSRVTDKFGRYYILVPKGMYYLEIDKKNEDGSYSKIFISGIIDAQKGIIQEKFVV